MCCAGGVISLVPSPMAAGVGSPQHTSKHKSAGVRALHWWSPPHSGYVSEFIYYLSYTLGSSRA
jgi:hypothetical protein